ncbi:uncharacterized protein LOC119746290 isoform X1 [Patiria miniata]|uniref:Uncharacterized protein n=1 Tax=Patiria miniata TaxID=46514 RepID=A0A914BS03_PATMI|nr:uncharacterized protein LOC119746290 isoform X1 [Patiria miniata]
MFCSQTRICWKRKTWGRASANYQLTLMRSRVKSTTPYTRSMPTTDPPGTPPRSYTTRCRHCPLRCRLSAIRSRLNNMVTPLWNQPYEDQLSTKQTNTREFLRNLSKMLQWNIGEMSPCLKQQSQY